MKDSNVDKLTFKYFKKRYKIAMSEIKQMTDLAKKKHKINYIYFIQNNITKDIYIGRSIHGAEERYKQHIRSSNRKKSDVYSTPLSVALREYGKDCFTVGYLDCIVCHIFDYSKANRLEQSYIKEVGTLYPNGYNLSGLNMKDIKKWREDNGK